MPNWNARNIVYGRAFAVTVLGAYGTDPAAALVVASKIRLSKLVGFNPNPLDTVAALAANEADFTGYTAGGYTPTFSAVVNLAANVIGKVAGAHPIAGTATPQVGNLIYGWWLDDGVNMIAAEAFPIGTTVGFNAPGDYLDIEIALPFMLLQKTA